MPNFAKRNTISELLNNIPAIAALSLITFAVTPAGALAQNSNQGGACESEALFHSANADTVAGIWDRATTSLENIYAFGAADCEPEDLRWRAELLLGNLRWKRGDIIGGETLLLDVRRRATASGHNQFAAEAQLALAEIVFVRAHIMGVVPSDDALEAYKTALSDATSVQRQDLMAKALGRIGVIFERRGDIDAAESYYVKSLSLAEISNAAEMMHLPLAHLGSINQDRENHEAAQQYYERALMAAKLSPAPEHLVFALNNYAENKPRSEQYNSEDGLLDVYRAHEIARRLGHQIAICISYVALASRNLEIENEILALEYAKSAQWCAAKNDFALLEGLSIAFVARLENPSQ